MSSSEEEFDYMSENFLEKCLPTSDVRPGLLHSRTQQRSHEILKKKTVTDAENKTLFRSRKVVEAERREEGLNVALSSENKGFSLMQKMGYKPGTGIGKSGSGLVEPIAVSLKQGRGGLGRDSALKQIAIEKAAIRRRMARMKTESVSAEDYRLRMTKKALERQTETDLHKSQRICEQLDMEKGFSEPAESWFWPRREKPDAENDNEEKPTILLEQLCKEEAEAEPLQTEPEIEFEPWEKLEMLTLYLRRTYNYCLWCGIAYDDEKDLQDNCPGMTRDEH